MTGGLSKAEVERRLREHGPNALPEPARTTVWKRLRGQLHSPLIYILVGALVFDLAAWAYEGASGMPFEALILLTVLAINSALGAWQEHRSEEALAKLKQLAAPQVWAMRDGHLVRIDGASLVLIWLAAEIVNLWTARRARVEGAGRTLGWTAGSAHAPVGPRHTVSEVAGASGATSNSSVSARNRSST